MTRTPLALLAVVLAAGLSGCPLPQPLADFPEGQPVTPPRIVVDGSATRVSHPETIVRVPASCLIRPVYPLRAFLRHTVAEPVVARWFIDYDPTDPEHADPEGLEAVIPPPAAGAADPTLRETPVFAFSPYLHDPPAAGTGSSSSAAGAVHVVELVVSNGFDPGADVLPTGAATDPELPFRTPLTTPTPFETQVYRWVFVTVPQSSAVPCPSATP